MEGPFLFWRVLPVFMCFCVTALCVDTTGCHIPNSTGQGAEDKLQKRISSLSGQSFRTDRDGYSYVVSICGDIDKAHVNDSIVQTKGNERTVLGRRNDTHISGGEMWVLLSYSSGDFFPNGSQCLGRRQASVFIVCCPEGHEEQPNLTLALQDPCQHTFVLPSAAVCTTHDELSGMTIFIIIVIVALSVYFIVGILYRRLAHNAQHCQQLPHFTFWSKLGGMCADGCNYMCRCDSSPEDSWNNITSNFDSADRDDALLRP